MEQERRQEVALWRYGVLGPLVSAELEHGDLRSLCEEAAGRAYRKPDGKLVKLSWRTIESWFYDYKQNGFRGLEPESRRDEGISRSIGPAIAEQIVSLKSENPRRSCRALIRILERAKKVARGELTKSSVHRLLKSHGLSTRPTRPGDAERRAYRHPRAGDCWMGDVMHGPQALDDQGRAHKVYLHSFLDSAVRLVPAAGFHFNECAENFEAELKQAVLKHGIPRMLYIDCGAAQKAVSLALICAELGTHLIHCKPYQPEEKGGIERWYKTCRAEFCSELPTEPLPIGELNARLWAWISTEYHRRVHGGTGRVPLEHWLEQAGELRPAPEGWRLDAIFLHRSPRQVRKDGTVRYQGQLLEVRGELAGCRVELRYHPMRRFDPQTPDTWPKVYQNGVFVCDTVLLDAVANSARPRRRIKLSLPERPTELSGLDPLQQMLDEQARVRRPPKEE